MSSAPDPRHAAERDGPPPDHGGIIVRRKSAELFTP